MESCLMGTWDWSRILFLLTSLTVCQRVLWNLCFIHFPWVFTIILCLPCLIVLWLFCLVFSLSATVMMEKLLHVCLQSSILYLIHFRVLYLDTSCLLWWFCLISLLSVCHCQPIVSFVLCYTMLCGPGWSEIETRLFDVKIFCCAGQAVMVFDHPEVPKPLACTLYIIFLCVCNVSPLLYDVYNNTIVLCGIQLNMPHLKRLRWP